VQASSTPVSRDERLLAVLREAAADPRVRELGESFPQPVVGADGTITVTPPTVDGIELR
jgi:hypothetical protein